MSLGIGGGLAALNSSLRPSNINTASTSTQAFDSTFAYLLGRISTVNPWYTYAPDGSAFPNGTGRSRSYSYKEYEVYAQDNWRIGRDLTLNLGLRYQLYPAPYERNGFQADNKIDFESFVQTRIANAAAGIGGAGAEPLLTYEPSSPVIHRSCKPLSTMTVLAAYSFLLIRPLYRLQCVTPPMASSAPGISSVHRLTGRWIWDSRSAIRCRGQKDTS